MVMMGTNNYLQMINTGNQQFHLTNDIKTSSSVFGFGTQSKYAGLNQSQDYNISLLDDVGYSSAYKQPHHETISHHPEGVKHEDMSKHYQHTF
jgi:hypothetical protein